MEVAKKKAINVYDAELLMEIPNRVNTPLVRASAIPLALWTLFPTLFISLPIDTY